ncbi:MAG: nucleotide exchange factor GrpE [Candidatus Methanoplasma sp.]|nr:nucleotide exchange factor GrpE [Candidatus Methanoplasma sp.]
MIEKKRPSKTSKLKNFLVTGTIDEEGDDRSITDADVPSETSGVRVLPDDMPEEDYRIPTVEIVIETEEPAEPEPETGPAPQEDLCALEAEIAELKEMVAALASELGKYATSKEQLKEYTTVMNRRDAEIANRKFLGMLEQLSAMREDFFKLCNGINAKLDSFSSKDILGSFEAYGVDMENILVDSGVQIGPSKFERLNTLYQRIVDVIPTDDESINGMIAERVSDGYVYQGRVLLKEKVKIYRFSENGRTEGD